MLGAAQEAKSRSSAEQVAQGGANLFSGARKTVHMRYTKLNLQKSIANSKNGIPTFLGATHQNVKWNVNGTKWKGWEWKA